MATATAKKPAAPKLTAKAPTAKASGPKAPAAAKAAKPAPAPKEVKPYEPGEICIFKGYATEPPADQPKTEVNAELAVVGQRVEGGQTFVACVAPQDYHRYMENPDAPDAPDGAEFAPTELKRTSKRVEEPFALVPVGEYEALTAETPDLLERATKLYSRASEAFFYLGGTFAELWKGRDEQGNPLFANYPRPDGATAPDDATAIDSEGNYATNSQGFELFLGEHFPGVGGIRKAKALIAVYETFSGLPNAADIVAKLPAVGWFKADMIASHVTTDNVEKLVEAAEEHSVVSLRSHLQETYVTEKAAGSGGTTNPRVTIKKTTYQFQLFEDRGTGVTMILDAAKKQLGIQDDNALFEHIITEWAGQSLGPDAVSKANTAAEKRTEALVKSGVKLPETHPAYKPPEAKTEAAPEAAPAPARRTLKAPAKQPVAA